MSRHSTPNVTYKSLDFLDLPHYKVGDDGSVWSCRPFGKNPSARSPRPWCRLRSPTGPKGYPLVVLRNGTGRRSFRVHTLVLLAFVGPCPEGMECRHLDGARANNALTNLRWGSPLENSADRQRHGRQARGERQGSAKLTEVDVVAIRHLHATEGRTLTSLANQFGISFAAVHAVIARRNWRHVP